MSRRANCSRHGDNGRGDNSLSHAHADSDSNAASAANTDAHRRRAGPQISGVDGNLRAARIVEQRGL